MTRFVYNEETTAPSIEVDGVGSFYKVYPETNYVQPDEFEKMLFVANVPLDDQELYHLAGAIGYAWQSTVKGDRMESITRHGANAFYVDVELLSSIRSDPTSAFADFVERIETIVNEGSPVRKNGTRKVDPLIPSKHITVGVYVDNVVEPVDHDYIPARSQKVEQKPSADDWDYVAPSAQVETEKVSVPEFDALRAELTAAANIPNLTSREKYFMELAEKALATAEARDARNTKVLKVIEKALDAIA